MVLCNWLCMNPIDITFSSELVARSSNLCAGNTICTSCNQSTSQTIKTMIIFIVHTTPTQWNPTWDTYSSYKVLVFCHRVSQIKRLLLWFCILAIQQNKTLNDSELNLLWLFLKSVRQKEYMQRCRMYIDHFIGNLGKCWGLTFFKVKTIKGYWMHWGFGDMLIGLNLALSDCVKLMFQMRDTLQTDLPSSGRQSRFPDQCVCWFHLHTYKQQQKYRE